MSKVILVAEWVPETQVFGYLKLSIIYPGKKVGFVTNPQINEASGLVASQTHSDLFWTLNDSDGPNCIYALAKNGTLALTLCLEYAENYDWEAISTAPCDKK